MSSYDNNLCFSVEEKFPSCCSVSGAAVCSPIGWDHRPVTLPEKLIEQLQQPDCRERPATDQLQQPDCRERPATDQLQQPDCRERPATDQLQQPDQERDQLQTCNKYGTCPQDWIRSCCSCYYISPDEKTWEDSRKDCQTRGANLVIINSREEQALIKAFNKRAWFGLTDIEVEGTWRWVDGTPLTTSYWTKGEPNDLQEDCALVDNTQKGPSSGLE
ncbi:CD209 antigen-like [Oncorhynchus keta]|uniref:CD209 antigen-like n=1 Tax=Oncorhynchus keta TaxID=8018 RepID=UPI00227D4D6E|nr:CD209 antigen-like [Oncorhynchus keta]